MSRIYLICVLCIFCLFCNFSYSYSEGLSKSTELPKYFFNEHRIESDDKILILYFKYLPYGPGANFDVYARLTDRSMFSPVYNETIFLGPVVYHGGILRAGGMLDGCTFLYEDDRLVMYCGRIEFLPNKERWWNQ